MFEELPTKPSPGMSSIFDNLPGMKPKAKPKSTKTADNKYEWGVVDKDGNLLEKAAFRRHAVTRADILGGFVKRLGPVVKPPKLAYGDGDGYDAEGDSDFD